MPLTPPDCCDYSKLGDGYPCWHGVAVICKKHGSGNMWKFVDERLLTRHWKALYVDLEFRLPAKSKVDAVMPEAKKLVRSGDYLRCPKALAPPRGRPVKNAGVRRKAWYENGTTKPKKRAYVCSLCHQPKCTRDKCPLRQMNEAPAEEGEGGGVMGDQGECGGEE